MTLTSVEPSNDELTRLSSKEFTFRSKQNNNVKLFGFMWCSRATRICEDCLGRREEERGGERRRDEERGEYGRVIMEGRRGESRG